MEEEGEHRGTYEESESKGIWAQGNEGAEITKKR